MAKDVGKPGLTTFGWLVIGGVAAAVLGNKERRDKLLGAAKGFTDKLNPQAAKTTDTGPNPSA